MNFAEKLFELLEDGFNFLIDFLYEIVLFLAKPLAYLLQFLEGIFYLFYVLFDVVVVLIQIFVALFQFLFALTAGVFRTIQLWLTVNPDLNDVNLPNQSYTGFSVVIDQLQPTGFMTVVPTIAIAVTWFYFVLKIIGLFGGQIMVMPFGRKEGDD